ncbi:MAG: hypothetical protein GY909_08075 [Oligoflexia bacterium]|nr:hypothetical protein [Oligoflexia bacterium]
MSNENAKPLIFLEPLSETLKKLKEVIEQNSEAEGIEVFDVETLEEAKQLIPSIGQALILVSHPKKCAMMLQQNRKVIKKLQSKTIMLSPKTIPRKTMDKFMKVGLTECVVEPVNPKTLLYKVKLQLRSIATKKESGEMQKKFEDGNNEQIEEEEQKLKKLAKKQAEAAEEEVLKKEKNEDADASELYNKEKKKSNYKEESIDGYYKGKKKKNDEEEDASDLYDTDKKKKEAEDLGGHYSGKLSKKLDVEAEEDHTKERALTEEEELDEIKKKITLEVDQEDMMADERHHMEEELEEREKKKKASLNLEEDDSKDPYDRGENVAEDLGGHYKGDVKKGLDIEADPEITQEREDHYEDDAPERKKKAQLAIDDDGPEDYVDESLPEEEREEKKKRAKLEVDSEDIYEDKKPKLEVQADDDDLYEKEDLPEAEIQDKRDKASLDIVNENEDDDEDRGKVDEIDGYLRGGAAKKNLDVEADPEITQERESHDEDGSEDLYKKAKLDIANDSDGDDDLYASDDEDEQGKRKKNASLDLESEKTDKDVEFEGNEDDLDEFNRKQAKLNVDDDSDYGKRDGAYQEKEQKYGNRANARADHIKTHYSSKESLKHGDDDWGDNWEKPKKQEEEFPEQREELALIIPQDDDLGEQTIDYGQLKKEFDEINWDDLPRKRKNKSPIITSVQPVLKTFKRTVYNEDGEEEIIEEAELIEEEVSGRDKVFEPNPVGMDVAIKVLNLYYDKEKTNDDIFEYAAHELYERYKGFTSYYVFDKEKGNYDEVYNQFSKIEITDEEAKGSEHKEDIEAIKEKWDEILGEGKAGWQNAKLPIWEDQSFQAQKNIFVFPLYEGVNSLGFNVVYFDYQFKEEDSKTIEMILESTRGLFLQIYEDKYGTSNGVKKAKKQKTDEESAGKKIKGFFGGLFGKKAG